jgi:hypothetical protein
MDKKKSSRSNKPSLSRESGPVEGTKEVESKGGPKDTKRTRVKDVVDESPETIEIRKIELEMLVNLKSLSDTCIEVMRTVAPKPKLRRVGTKAIENNNITWSIVYRDMLDLPTFRLNTQHELFRELYEKFRHKILKSGDDKVNDDDKGVKNTPNIDWMCNETVEIFFGSKLPALKKKNIRLRISNAYSDAVALREEIDSNTYPNVNAKAKAKGDHNYVYSEIIQYEFLVVVIDAIGKDHKDFKRLTDIASEFKTLARMDENSNEDASEDSNDMSSMIKGITGENVKSSDATKIMKTFTRDGNMIKTMSDVFGEIKQVHSKNPDAEPGAGMEEIIIRMAPRFAQFGSQITSVIKEFKKDESSESESESGTTDDDVSDASSD